VEALASAIALAYAANSLMVEALPFERTVVNVAYAGIVEVHASTQPQEISRPVSFQDLDVKSCTDSECKGFGARRRGRVGLAGKGGARCPGSCFKNP